MAVTTPISNARMFVGNDKTFLDTIYQADGVTPQDISGWSLAFFLHEYGNPDNVFVTKTTGSGIVLTAPTLGQLTITLHRADTLGMFAGQFQYSVTRTDTGFYLEQSLGLFTLLEA